MFKSSMELLAYIWLLSLGLSIASADSPASHPCSRPCVEGETMTCRYTFTVDKYFAMGKACYDCPRNATDCRRPECVALDGVPRPVTAVNRQIPGPQIEVCLGDKIVVDVQNEMAEETTSIHWHGMHQNRNPYMDGVPFVTQCPISPVSTFRYTMHADNAGTLLWHAHSGFQLADGVFGALVVRVPDSKNTHKHLYDEDLSEHVLVVNDWTHTPSGAKYLALAQGQDNNKADVFLINGKGRFYNDTKQLTNTPLAVFKVKKDQRYRFRLINAGAMNCPVEMFIDNHIVTFIASDGYDFDPVVADSLISYAGERWDFVLSADKEVGNYWMRFTGLMDCDRRFTSAHQVAVLHYDGAPEVEPTQPVGYGLHPKPTWQLNPLNKGKDEPNTLSVPSLKASSLPRNENLLKEKADIHIDLAFDFYALDHPSYHKKGLYGFNQVDPKYKKYTPQFNHLTFKWPHSPLMTQIQDVPEDFFCSKKEDLERCKREFCECTIVYDIPLNSVVEVILVDKGRTYEANHPFHLHGHSFAVVATDRVGRPVMPHQVRSLDESGQIVRNLHNPPMKDTVTVPDGGYTILRFLADNPGYWLFHCHIEYHIAEGMVVVFKVGEQSQFLPPPRNFPTCGDFKGDEEP